MLEGSVQRSGSQVRVNAQLIDAETDAHLWAERFDRDTAICSPCKTRSRAGSRLRSTLSWSARRPARPTDHPDALDYILRGRAAIARSRRRATTYAEAISLFERALALDPRSVEAQSLVGEGTRRAACSIDMTDTAAADIARAEGLVGQALAASPRSPLAHFAKGQVLRAQSRCEEAIPEYETVLAFNRNCGGALRTRPVQALHRVDRGGNPARRSKPSASARAIPTSAIGIIRIGLVHLLQSRIDEAIVWLEKARSANPGHPSRSRLPRLRLCPQRRDRTRCRRTRRGPEAER